MFSRIVKNTIREWKNCIYTTLRLLKKNEQFGITKYQNTAVLNVVFGSGYLDYSKTFNGSDHDLLIAKLNHYCAQNLILFFKYYLRNRCQRIQK